MVYKTLAELNRNQVAVLDELHETREPIVLTRNGEPAAVLVDIEEYRRQGARADAALQREERVYQGILSGWEDYQDGRVQNASSALGAIRAKRDW